MEKRPLYIILTYRANKLEMHLRALNNLLLLMTIAVGLTSKILEWKHVILTNLGRLILKKPQIQRQLLGHCEFLFESSFQ